MVREKENAALGKESCVARMTMVRKALVLRHPLLMILYKELCLNTNKLHDSLSSSVDFFLQEYNDVFPDEIPACIPPI